MPDDMTPEQIAAAEAEALRLAAEVETLKNSEDPEALRTAELAAAKAAQEAEEAREQARKKAEADKNKPTDAQAEALKEIMKWKKRAKEAEERAALFDGINPAKAREALEAQTVAERKELEARGEYDRILTQVNDQHAADLAVIQGERDRLRAELDEMTVSSKKKDIANKFAGSQFVRENLNISGTKVQVLYGDHYEYVGDDLVGYDKPKGSPDRTPLVDGQGKYLPFEASLEKIVKADPEYANVAKSTIRRGAGSSTNGLNADIPVVLNTSQDKIKNGLQHLKRSSIKLREE